MHKKYVLVFLGWLILAGCSIEEDSHEFTIEKLQIGGQAYFGQFAKSKDFVIWLREIENGNTLIIESIPLYIEWADPATREKLAHALSKATTKSPDAVMQLVPEYFALSDVCTIPYTEQPVAMQINHIHESLAALKKSDVPTGPHFECIAIYEEMRNTIM